MSDISVVALRGVPEIAPGDDLTSLLVEAIRATPGALPLAGDDVLVVTQKIVSKAQSRTVVLDDIVPSAAALKLAQEIGKTLAIPVIGIGAGAGCDGQVLVLYDILGLNPKRPPRFSRDFMQGRGSIMEAVADYVAAVRDGTFPGSAETTY